MRQSRFFLLLASVALSAVCLFSSCSKEETLPREYGQISLSIHADVDLDEATKAVELPQSDYSKYNVTLYKDGEVQWKTTYEVFLNDVQYNRVAAGTYTLEVESCTEAEAEVGNGVMRFCGSEEVTVVAGRRSAVGILCEMANARVTLAIDPSFASELVNTGASVTDYRREVSFAVVDTQHLLERAVYFNVEQGADKKALIFTVTSGVTSVDKVMTFEVHAVVEAGKWNKVTLKNK